MTGDAKEYSRFDSITALKAHCRREYATENVTVASTEQGELRVRVVRSDGAQFDALVVHLEGEMLFLVRLPAAGGAFASRSDPRTAAHEAGTKPVLGRHPRNF